MPRFLIAVLTLSVLVSPSAAQALAPDNGGNGSDGAFVAPPGVLILNTAVKQVYQCTTFTVNATSTINVTGPFPLLIKAQGAVLITGIINASGAAGGAGGNGLPGGAGGVGGPGGHAGGVGGAAAATPFNGAGQAGFGPGGGQPGFDSGTVGGSTTQPVGGGGGGGNGTAGATGGPPNTGGTSASGAGGPAVIPCRGGSGGGGGGGDIDSGTTAASNDGGGGGGGGGGDIVILSNASITVNGALLANGGAGGTSPGNGGGGGGGSGGSIELHAPVITINGMLHAVAGIAGAATQTNVASSPGGAGGAGCITIGTPFYVTGGGASVTPLPALTTLGLVLTPYAPASGLLVTAVGGTSNYIVAAALTLAPVPIVLPQGTFFLDLTDPLLNLLFPVNNLPFVFSGLTGSRVGRGRHQRVPAGPSAERRHLLLSAGSKPDVDDGHRRHHAAGSGANQVLRTRTHFD